MKVYSKSLGVNQLQLQGIRNIIFDLGGVIIDLDFDSAYREFSKLSGHSEEEVRSLTSGLTYFADFEKGTISATQFRNELRSLLNIPGNDEYIDNAWNSLLGGIPPERLQLLKTLKRHYKLIALSNTNEIHVKEFNKIVSRELGSMGSFEDHFDVIYFSHQMKMRKPDEEIYKAVLEEQQLLPQETLFIDDNADNINGAASTGLNTYHLTDARILTKIFHGALTS